jgi:hypothetical protein
LIALAFVLAFAVPAHAVVVLKKGTTEPLIGYLVRQDETTIVVREQLADGTSREQAIRRADIDELVVTVSPERLTALDPGQPQLYREYAEELAEKARDPEAREAAVRLYAIAAWHGDAKLRKSALLGLAGLAGNPALARRYRAAAYLYDPAHEPALIAREAAVPPARTDADRDAMGELLRALRAIRQGKPTEARTILDRETVRPPLELLAPLVTREELLALATTRPLADASMRTVLAAELALERALAERPVEPAAMEQAAPSWGNAARAGGLAPLPSLDLLHLTPFDPRACAFQGGKWVMP